MTLSLSTARNLIASARAYGASHDLSPLTIVVLDAGGNLIAAEREDGAANKRYEIADGKAAGALALGIGSRALMTRAEQQPFFIAAATSAVGRLIPVPGGVLIYSTDGYLIGAAGVSGDTSDNDEAAAVKGIETVGLLAQTDDRRPTAPRPLSLEPFRNRPGDSR